MLEEAVLLKHMKIPTPKRLMGLILGGPTVNRINVCRVQPTLSLSSSFDLKVIC